MQIARTDAEALIKRAMRSLQEAGDLFNAANQRLYGYEHHAVLRDAVQLVSWRCYDQRNTATALLNAILAPEPPQPAAASSAL